MPYTPPNTFTANFTRTTDWNVSQTVNGLSNPVGNNNTVTKKIAYAIGTGAGQANMLVSQIRTLAASANETIDLTATLTDILNQTGANFARIKGLEIQLLSVADDSVNGTAAVSITVGAAAATPFLGPLGGTTPTITIPNGGEWSYSVGNAAGWVTAGANNLKIANNDAGVAAAYRITLIGANT